MKKFIFLIIAAFAGTGASAQMLINGAGATFPAAIYAKWFAEYAKVDPSVSINYQAIGSGAGVQQIMSETVDFGASDDPVSDAILAKAPRTLWHFPTVAGAVVISYNLPGNPTIRLDGPTVANIYLGNVTKWNDPAITGQNPGVDLPDQDILVVYRTDGSGTTANFTGYLSKISPEWMAKVGHGKSVKWPIGLGGKGNPGVTGQVKESPGAIGYIELTYARQNNLPCANLKNAAGNYITPSIDSVTAAMATAKVPDDFRFSMLNAPGENAYPISTATWLLVYQQQKDPVKGRKLVEFLKWAYSDGEKMAPALDFAPIPGSLVQRALARVDSIAY